MFGVLGLLAFPFAIGAGLGAALLARKMMARRLGTLPPQPQGDGLQQRAAVPWPQRLIVMLLAGAATYALATVMFTLSFWLFGVAPAPKPIDQLEAIVAPVQGGVAEQAGMRSGDRITSLGGDRIESWSGLVAAVKRHEGRTIEVTSDRDGQPVTMELTLPVPGRLGVRAHVEQVEVGLLNALGRGSASPAVVLWQTAKGVYQSVADSQTSTELGGPVMMYQQASRESFRTGQLVLVYGGVTSYMGIPTALIVAMFMSLRRPREEQDDR